MAQAGFTLLEVLVAGTILSLVLATLYGVFSQTLGSKRLAEERIARSRAARGVLVRLGEELQASFPLPGGEAGFVGETRRERTTVEAFLSFVSFIPAPLTTNGREGDLCQVSYVLTPDPRFAECRQLLRRVNCDPQGLGATREQSESEDVFPLLSELRGMGFRFFDGRTWLDTWGEDETRNSLPLAVEATVYFPVVSQAGKSRGGAEDLDTFATVIDLPMGGVVSNPRPGGA